MGTCASRAPLRPTGRSPWTTWPWAPATAPADCTVAVNDSSATAATATLAGCTVSAPPPSTTPSLVALTLSQTTVVGGTPVTATVSLTSLAPAGGVVVSLSSDNTTAATVPPSGTVPGG